MRRQRNNLNANKILSVKVFVILILLFSSCSKEDDSVPSYRTDLVCVVTNNDSLITTLLLDDGHSYDVSSQRVKGSPNDTIRCLSNFMINSDSVTATLYQTKAISCYSPLPVDSFTVQPHDPVTVNSVWKSGNYVNLYLSFLTNGVTAKHHYDFCIDSITSKTLHVSLLFKRDSKVLEAYTTSFYHSIPLSRREYSCDFDSLVLYINTKDGRKTYPFEVYPNPSQGRAL